MSRQSDGAERGKITGISDRGREHKVGRVRFSCTGIARRHKNAYIKSCMHVSPSPLSGGGFGKASNPKKLFTYHNFRLSLIPQHYNLTLFISS